MRRFPDGPYVLRRTGRHVHDEQLDQRLPTELRALDPTLVFPSIHRSSQNVRSLTVHPLGNPGPTAEVGGRPRTLVPTDPPLMTDLLRTLAEEGAKIDRPATFEATHHGPELGLPALFVEIGYGELPGPPEEEVRLLARLLASLHRSPATDVAVGVGGGHYAPHFTDLALRREWAFGHLLSRHALAETDRSTTQAAVRLTPGAAGLLYARASDQDLPVLEGVAPRLRESQAPTRRPR